MLFVAKILNMKTGQEEKVQITIEEHQKQIQWLEGNMDNMHIFSENNLKTNTKLVKRGKRESTKYFLIPRELRCGNLMSDNAKCTAIDGKTKQIYIFSVNKY